MNVAPLAYKSVLAHLLPGAVGLYPASVYVPVLPDFLGAADGGRVSLGIGTTVYVVVAALVIGLCLDAIRYVSVDLILHRALYGADSLQFMKRVKSEEDLRFYQSVIDTSYAFYQFYTNTALALCAMLLLWQMGSLDKPSAEHARLLAFLLILVLLGAGLRAMRSAAKKIHHRFNT